MGYGSLTVITGGMFAGKTSTLIIEAENRDAVVFKPAFDTRYSASDCVTHDGVCHPAHTFASFRDIAQVGELNRPYCFDEVQFLDGDRYQGDFVNDVRTLLTYEVDVICSGLDMDWKGEPFSITAKLLAMADRVIKLGSICSLCGSIGTKSFKKNGSNTIELGAEDLYEPRCNRHWGLRDGF